MSGTVKSAAGGAALAATLYIKRDGDPYVTFPTAAATGFYARPLVPGSTYTLVASAAGYLPQELNVTAPAGGGGVVQNFALASAPR